MTPSPNFPLPPVDSRTEVAHNSSTLAIQLTREKKENEMRIDMVTLTLNYGDALAIEQVLRDRAIECRGYADKYPTNARAFHGSSDAYEALAQLVEDAIEASEG
jgi:hypothetical protein